jgi:hypothetical protein
MPKLLHQVPILDDPAFNGVDHSVALEVVSSLITDHEIHDVTDLFVAGYCTFLGW